MNWQTIKKSEILKNTSILVSGTALAQLIPILFQPLLRRLFSPELYGIYSVYLSILGILVIVSSLRIEQAIILPEKDKSAANLLFLSIIISLFFNVFLLGLIIMFKSSILSLLNIHSRFSLYLYFLPLGTFLFSCYQSINIWLIRQKKFKAISINKFVRRSTEVSGQIGTSFSFNSFGLLFGDLLGHASNVFIATIQSIRAGLTIKFFNIQTIKKLFVVYSDFPKYNSLGALMGAFSTLFPTIVINKYFSSEYAGYYDLSKLVLSIPFALIATAVSNVLLQVISKKYREKKSIKRNLYKVLVFTVIIAILEIFIIHFFGIELFSFVFGKSWQQSGQISKILVWSYSINFIIATFSFLFVALNRIKIYSFWQFIYFLLVLSILFLTRLPFLQFLQLYVFIVIFSFIINIFFGVFIVKKYEDNIKMRN